MRSKFAISSAFLVLLVASASLAGVGPDWSYCTTTRAYTGIDPLVLMVSPDGSGNDFTQAYLPFGGTEDATLTLTVVDINIVPIVDYPREDIWLESLDGGLVSCPGGTTANSNTDVFGQTTWQLPMFAGGWSQDHCRVMISGSPVLEAPIPVDFVSPDISGDLKVDLTDLGIFSSDYFGPYTFRSDLKHDGSINLADLGVLAGHYADSCP